MKLKSFVMSIAAILILSFPAWGQTNQLQGNVKLKNADGSTSPAAKYNVDIYRLDIAVGEWHVQTDKAGHWSAFITSAGGTYLVVASGEGRMPNFVNNVRGTSVDPIEIVLEPGDGRKVTKQDILAAIKNRNSGGGGAADPGQAAATAARQKEDEAKRRAANEKAKAEFESMKQHFEQGNKYFDANDFGNAVNEFKAAAAIDDSQHVVFARLAQASFNLGVESFNKSSKAQQEGRNDDAQAGRAEAEKLWQESAAAGEKALALQETNANYKQILASTYAVYGQRYGKPEFTEKACNLYVQIGDAAATSADKANAYNKAGKTYFDAGNVEKATESYNKTIAIDSNNIVAIYGIGLALVSTGEEAKIKEGLNLFAKVVETGPATSKEVADAKAMIQQIKDAYNLMPQPGSKGTKRKG